MDMDLESYGPEHLDDRDYRYDDGGYVPELQEMERPRGRPDRMRPRGGRWNRDDEPGRRVRSRSRERDHWDDYDDYDGYEERDSRDRRDRYRDRGRDERYRDRDERFYSDRDRDRVGRDRRDRGRNRRRRSSDRYDREDEYRPRDYDYEDNDRCRNSRSGSEIPTTLVMMRGLPYSATEEDVTAELLHGELAYRDVKIIKDKQGESRGFGFVEFHDVKEAEKWMYVTQGSLVILDRTVHLEYGKPRPTEQDWACSKCGTLNYASRRRTTCFSCGAPKDEAAEDPYNYEDYCNDTYYDEDSLSSSGGGCSQKDRDAPAQAPPCNILIMRGLDVNTTEETVRNNIVQVADIPIFDVRLIKDKVSGVSRGFCFIELGSTEDATKLLDIIQAMDPPYSVENKKVLVGYARNTLHPPPSKPKSRSESKPARQRNAMHAGNTKIANTAIAQAQAAQAQGYYDQQQVQGQQFAQGTPASQQTTGPQATQGQLSQTVYSQGQDSTSGEASQQQYQQYQQYYQQAGGVQQGGQVQTQQGQMFHQMYDISSFTYDQNTGYYYDPNSGLYYDVNTGYHYNGSTGQFLYWEPNQQQYYVVNQDGSLSVPFTGAGGTTSNAQDFGTDPNKDKDKVPHKPSGPSARKIAKDMERWAKKMNEATAIKQTAVRQAMQELKAQEAREEALRKQMEDEGVFKKPQLPTLVAPASKKVKSLFTPDEDGESPLLGGTQKPKKQSLVAEYGGDDSDEETDIDNKFIDLNKLACLLCQRKFGNRETLLKHQQLSDLHKQNLEKYKKRHAT